VFEGLEELPDPATLMPISAPATTIAPARPIRSVRVGVSHPDPFEPDGVRAAVL
jgi:hypothetical protein